MRTLPTFVTLVVGIATGLGVTGCSYGPHLKDGELQCSASGQCPEGFACQNDACFATSTAPSQTLLNRYIGTWTLNSTATVSNHCDDGSAEIRMLSPVDKPSTMMITAGSAGKFDLESVWLCTLGLSVNAAGAHFSQMVLPCSQTSTDPTLPSETWTVIKFDIVLGDLLGGLQSAMHTATYTRLDQYANGTVVTCSQAVTAPLTKN